MSYKLVIAEPEDPAMQTPVVSTWPARIHQILPQVEVEYCRSMDHAKEAIAKADAAYGDIVPDLFSHAQRLRWIQSPQAGPKAGYYHNALAESDVVVTNMRGIFNDHIAAHIMSYVLSFARGLPIYRALQNEKRWHSGASTVHLPEATAVIVGVGGIGSETGRLCSEFGMKVIGVDTRLQERPSWIDELHRPNALDDVIGQADFLIVTVPETPDTQGLFNRAKFGIMKKTAYFINIGRGATTNLSDLRDAVVRTEIAGAALDVYEEEPLPVTHQLWSLPNVIMTPHVAAAGPYIDDRRTEVFLDNCTRFAENQPMRNIVDKDKWF